MKTVTQYVKQKVKPFLESGKDIAAQYFKQETSNQKRLREKLDDALKRINDTEEEYGDVKFLRDFLEENKDNKDLKFVLNLRQGQSKSTVLHDVAANTYADAEEVADLLIDAGADPNIRNKKGKTPLQVAVSNGCYSVVESLLTDKHRKLNKELHGILNNIHKEMPDYWADDYHEKYGHLKFEAKPEGIAELKEFLAKYKGDEDLKIVLNLQNTSSGTVLHNPEYFRIKEVVELLLKAGTDPNIKNEKEKSIVECVIDAACSTTESGKNKEKYQEILKLLIDAKADIHLKDKYERTLLHYAAMAGKASDVEFLLASIEDEQTKAKLVNAQDNDDNTALLCATHNSERSNSSMVRLLLEHGACCDIQNKEGDTVFHKLAYLEDDEALEVCLEKDGLGVNVENKKGVTPLLVAAHIGEMSVLERMLKNGAKIAHRDKEGNTVLHYAVINQFTGQSCKSTRSDECHFNYESDVESREGTTYSNITLLIHNGADVRAKNKHGHDPLFFAVEHRKSGTVDLLLRSGADISAVDENGFTVFHFAIKQSSINMLNVLLPKKTTGEIDVEKARKHLGVIDKEGNTLLHHAIKWGCSEGILDFLVENGVDINAKNKHGVAPIHIAAKYGNPSQMEFFIKKKADLNARCGKLSKPGIDNIGKEKGFSSNNYINIQDGNLDANNTVDIKDDTEHKNAPPISIATESSHKSIVSTLLYEGAKPNIKDSRGLLPLHIAIKRACDQDCTEKERKEKYEIIKKLASVSAVTKGTLNAFRNFISHDGEEIEKILQDAIERKNSEKSPTAPVDEEASAPLFDDNFYNDIGSHITEPTTHLYPDLSKELAFDDYGLAEWDPAGDHGELQHQRKETENAWGDDNWETSSVHKDLGTSYWDVAKSLTEKPEDQKNVTDKQKDQKQNSFTLTLNQRTELNKFLDMVSKAQDINALEKIVNEALNSGVRLNARGNEGHSFTDSVISQISKLKQDLKITSNIVCRLVAKGAALNKSYEKIDKALEIQLKDYKANMRKADSEFWENISKLKEIASISISKGELKNLEIDNTTFYLEYSADSVVDVAKVINGAKSFGFSQGCMAFGSNIVKIGESEVEVETRSDIRNYTDINGDVTLTFYTGLGELNVSLSKNKDLIIVKVNEQDRFNQLVSSGEEIGKGCQLGGLSVYEAIINGSFKRSGKLQSSEIIKQKVGEDVEKIVKDLKCGEIVNSSLDNIRLPQTPIHKNKARAPAA